MNKASGRWTARRKVELLLQVFRGERKLVDVCRKHGLEPSVVEGWMERFLAAGERGLKARVGGEQAGPERQVRKSGSREERPPHELMQLEELYRTAPIGLALLDANLRYLRINESLADINGLSAREHLGRTLREVLPDMADTLEPQFREVLTTGKPMLDVELSGRTPRQPDTLRHWRAAYCPLRDQRGAVAAISCVVQDVTEEKRAQEALRQNEERLRITSLATNDAVWDWNLVTDATWWSEGLRTLFGYADSGGGPTAATWWSDRIHPDEREQVVSRIHAVIDSGERFWSAEYRYRRADGSYADVHDRGQVIHDADGKPVRMVGAMMDISERKRAEQEVARLTAELERRVRDRTAQLEAANLQLEHEIGERRQAAEALQRSQQQLQEIIDNTTAVIYLKDIDGRYLLVNRQYEALFHVSREEVVGKTDYDVFPREAADAFRANDREVLAINRALNFEENVPHNDGMHIYISVKFPLTGGRGNPYGVCGISTDITLRKQMEGQLRASQAQLSALIESTSDAIWSIDDGYRITAFNSAAARRFNDVYGRPLSLGALALGLVPDEESRRWQALYDRVLAGEHVELGIERQTSAGELRAYLVSMTPILTDGRVTGATGFSRDITDLRRAEESARRHQAELTHVQRVATVGEMAAGLAHEINQPLGAIANYAQGCRLRILSGAVRPDDLLPAVERIAAEALRAGEIIRRLRQLVRRGETTREAVDLNDIVTEAVQVVQPQARELGVALTVDLTPGLPRVEVDHIQIEQVIVNLLMNGLEAMQTANSAKPELSVRTALTGEGAVEVAVQDAGTGLVPPISEEMFTPFFTSKPYGLGMGLAISRSIVEGHGGRIWGTNNTDCGAIFHVVLPRTGQGDRKGLERAQGDATSRPSES